MRHYTDETKPSREFFKKLTDMVFSMHEHNVCHGDFHRANIMILEAGDPCLLDVATARKLTEKSSWLERLLFGIFKRADEFSLARIVESYYPDMIDKPQCRSLRLTTTNGANAFLHSPRCFNSLRNQSD